MTHLKIQRSRFSADEGEEWSIVEFEDRGDAWYANTELIDDEGWRPYADSDAREIDVKQLLRKEYDVRY